MAAKFQKIASAIAKREGKKSQARIGDIREMIKILCDLEAEYYMAGEDLGNSPASQIFHESKLRAEKMKAKAARKK